MSKEAEAFEASARAFAATMGPPDLFGGALNLEIEMAHNAERERREAFNKQMRRLLRQQRYDRREREFAAWEARQSERQPRADSNS